MSTFSTFYFPISALAFCVQASFFANAQSSEAPLDSASDDNLANTEVIEVVGAASQVDLTKRFAGEQVARGGRAGIFGNLDFMDSPFSATAYTANLIEQQQAQNIGDVLQNDPTVRVTKGFGNFQEVYILRGFPVFSDDITLNGAFGILPRQYIAAEMIERVEVLRGANAFINGAAPGGSGVGGTINLVTKRAPVGGITKATLGYDNSNQLTGAVDIGRRLGDNDEWGFRFNGVVRNGEGAISRQEQDLSVFSIGMDYSGDKARFSADLGYQDNHIDSPRPQVTPFGQAPKAPDADANFAQDWTFSDEQQLFGVVRGEYDLGENTSIWLGAGFRNGEEQNDLANPNSDENGQGTAFRFVNTREDEVFSIDTGVRTEYAIAGLKQEMTVSAALVDLESKNAFAFSDFGGFAYNIFDPSQVTPPATDAFIGGDLNNPITTEKVRNESIAIANTSYFFDERLLATIGLRHQSINTQSFAAWSGELNGSYDDSKITPVLGIVVKQSDALSFYANYAESLQAGATAPDSGNGLPIENAGEVLAPFNGEQLELGVKYDGGNIGATANVFTLNRPNAVIENQIFSASGEQRSQGFEFTVFGEPLEGLRIVGGATYVNAELAKTQGGIDEGNTPIGVPELQTNINGQWDIAGIEGLSFDARWIYTSEQYTNTANTFEIDSWNRVDIGASYDFEVSDTLVNVRARVNNVFDSAYWASTGGFPGANYLILSEPRSLSISLSFDF